MTGPNPHGYREYPVYVIATGKIVSVAPYRAEEMIKSGAARPAWMDHRPASAYPPTARLEYPEHLVRVDHIEGQTQRVIVPPIDGRSPDRPYRVSAQ